MGRQRSPDKRRLCRTYGIIACVARFVAMHSTIRFLLAGVASPVLEARCRTELAVTKSGRALFCFCDERKANSGLKFRVSLVRFRPLVTISNKRPRSNPA